MWSREPKDLPRDQYGERLTSLEPESGSCLSRRHAQVGAAPVPRPETELRAHRQTSWSRAWEIRPNSVGNGSPRGQHSPRPASCVGGPPPPTTNPNRPTNHRGPRRWEPAGPNLGEGAREGPSIGLKLAIRRLPTMRCAKARRSWRRPPMVRVRTAYTLQAEDDDFGQPHVLLAEVLDDDQWPELVETVGNPLAGLRRAPRSRPSTTSSGTIGGGHLRRHRLGGAVVRLNQEMQGGKESRDQ